VRVPFPMPDGEAELTCDCGQEARVPTKGHALVVASIGMGLVFDPPSFPPPADFLPATIQCRRCGRIYEFGPDVR